MVSWAMTRCGGEGEQRLGIIFPRQWGPRRSSLTWRRVSENRNFQSMEIQIFNCDMLHKRGSGIFFVVVVVFGLFVLIFIG